MRYDAIITQTDTRKLKVRYDSEKKEDLQNNTAMKHLAAAEHYGPTFTNYKIDEITPVKPTRKDMLAEKLRESLVFRGWKEEPRRFPEDLRLTFTTPKITCKFERLADIMTLSAIKDGAVQKIIHYPEWCWENMEGEVMNDLDLIIKTYLEK